MVNCKLAVIIAEAYIDKYSNIYGNQISFSCRVANIHFLTENVCKKDHSGDFIASMGY
jgi:hypothetical protein